MTLKLPYIPGRDIKEWYDRHEIPISIEDAKKAAILARRAEKKVLGEVPHIPKPEPKETKDEPPRTDLEDVLHKAKEEPKELTDV